jgi:hypothetical protein
MMMRTMVNHAENVVMISADMSDSVKQKRPIHCPLFYGGFSFHMQGISRGGIL